MSDAPGVIRRYVSIMEACEICNVSRRTIYNWMAEGFLEVVRTPSGAVRIDQTTLLSKNNKRRARGHFKENLK